MIEAFYLAKTASVYIHTTACLIGGMGGSVCREQVKNGGKNMNYDEKCTSHLRCTSNICPLDPDIGLRNYIQGDGLCVHILDYLEGKATPFDNAIKQSKKVWRKKVPASVFQKRLKSRKQVRGYFKKGENNRVSTRTILHDEVQGI